MTARAKALKRRLFIISGPSGGGKTTLCKKLLSEDLGLVHSVSATTRPPRSEEKNGIDYIFVSEDEFETMVEDNEFLEYEENFGNMYGTPRRFIENALKKKKNVLLSIDVKGAMKVKRAYPKESVLIFMLPPSLKALEKRLHSRMSDAAETISERLKLAKKEISFKDKYDYTIVNDRLNSAYKKLKGIIIKETDSKK